MRLLLNRLKEQGFSNLETEPKKSRVSQDNEDVIRQWETMHMDLCLKVSAANDKSVQGSSHTANGDQTTAVEKLRIMDPLPKSISLCRLFRRDKSHIECYPKSLNWSCTKLGRYKPSEKSESGCFSGKVSALIDNSVRISNLPKWNSSLIYLKNILLQTSGSGYRRSSTTEWIPAQLGVNPPSSRPGDPVDTAPHKLPVDPPRAKSIDLENPSSQADQAIQEAHREEWPPPKQTAQNRQEMHFERSSRRNSRQIEPRTSDSNLDRASRRRIYPAEGGVKGLNSEYSTRRNSHQSDRISQEVNNGERSSRDNSYQKERNVSEFGYERSVRRNSNLIDPNIQEWNIDRGSKRGKNQGDLSNPKCEPDRPLRRNSKQIDLILPACPLDRQGMRNANTDIIDDAFRLYGPKSTAQRESVLVDKGVRNFNKSRWEFMSCGKPARPPGGSQRSKQKDVTQTDRNTKLNVPKRSSRWETMNIDKLHDTTSNPVKREPKMLGPIPKKSVPKRTAQWEQVEKRAYPQYTAAANKMDILNYSHMERPPLLFSGQRQIPLKPRHVSKIAGGDSRWDTGRLFDSAANTAQPNALIGETFQACRQSTSLMTRSTAHQETMLIDRSTDALTSAYIPQGRPIQPNPSHNQNPLRKTAPQPVEQDRLHSSANSVSISPMLPESRAARVQTQKEVIHADSPLKNAGIISAEQSGRGLGDTGFSAINEDGRRLGGQVSRSRGQLEAECEVVAMETSMQRSYAGEAYLMDGSNSDEPLTESHRLGDIP